MTFRIKTIIAITCIQSILLLFSVWGAMTFIERSNQDLLNQRISNTAHMVIHLIKHDMLEQDLIITKHLITELSQLKEISYIRIVTDNQIILQDGQYIAPSRLFSSAEWINDIRDEALSQRIDMAQDGLPNTYVEIGFYVKDIFQLMHNTERSIIGMALMAIFLVTLFSLLLSHHLTKGLTKLTSAARRLSHEGPGYEVEIDSNSEVNEVANAFNTMSRSLASSYDDLKIARTEAEQASESKTLFLASMSHEIRTPLNGVLGLLSLIQESQLNQQQRYWAETASQSGNFLLTIINDILDYTRMESNTLSLDYQPFNLCKGLSQVVNSFQPVAQQKSLSLELVIANNVPEHVIGDEYRIEQILHNIIGNAIKFTLEGHVTVTVSTDLEPQTSSNYPLQSNPLEGQVLNDSLLNSQWLKKNGTNLIELKIEISDTGIGIAQDAIPMLFKEFTMVDQSYSRGHEGSGLGLAICQRLCDLMEGDISVASELGQGSTFTVTLQLAIASSEATSPHSAPITKHPAIAPSAKILVAEDNKANQIVIKNMFLHAGITIDLAENGKEALEKVMASDYDIIFMDITMPIMDGMQACQAIRKLDNQAKASIPIIALTAHALHGDRERFIAAGLNHYLSKPVRLSQLMNTLDKFLSNHDKTNTEPATQHNHDSDITNSSTIIPTEPPSNVQSEKIDSELVDEAIIQQLITDTSADVLPMLIDHYTEECQLRLNNIHQAITNIDVKQLEFEAHTLGSSSLALGNRALSRLARKVEQLCRQDQAEQAFSLSDDINKLGNASIAALIERKSLGF
jgi:two-component system, sensor histidine kinase